MTQIDLTDAETPDAAPKQPIAEATQWQLIRMKLRQHKLARVSFWVLVFLYVVAAFAEFLAPHETTFGLSRYAYAPPQALRFFDRDAEGSLRFAPHVYGYKSTVDKQTLARTFVTDPAKKHYVEFFGKTKEYKLAGFIPMTRKLLAPKDPSQPFFLLGSDRLGRDMLSRVIHGGRITLSIGLIGVFISLVIGVAVGGVAGFFGGAVDASIQRVIEFIRSIPTIPLWLAMSAALPREWSSLTKYFMIILVLGAVQWTDMARVVSTRFLALKSEEFIDAAWLDGNSTAQIIFRYMAPNFTSYIVASATLAVPMMILGETSLSFLGLGLQPPIVSWGVLLQEAQNIRALVSAPWLLLPGVAVVLAILCMNALGDGLRDATDPYNAIGGRS